METEQATLVTIAKNQRWLIAIGVILLKAMCFAGILIPAREKPHSAELILGIIDVVLSLVVVRAVAVLMRSMGHSKTVTIVCCILLLVPLMGIVILVWLNGRATRRLRAASLKVGLKGVDPNDLDTREG